jgi:hypothetical protein
LPGLKAAGVSHFVFDRGTRRGYYTSRRSQPKTFGHSKQIVETLAPHSGSS